MEETDSVTQRTGRNQARENTTVVETKHPKLWCCNQQNERRSTHTEQNVPLESLSFGSVRSPQCGVPTKKDAHFGGGASVEGAVRTARRVPSAEIQVRSFSRILEVCLARIRVLFNKY